MALKGSPGPKKDARFFSVDYDGDFRDYARVEELVQDIRWTVGLTDGHEITDDFEVLWVNHFCDIGEVQDGEMLSWVDNPHLASKWAEGHEDMLWVPNGAHLLKAHDAWPGVIR